jgi:hypothetical protein
MSPTCAANNLRQEYDRIEILRNTYDQRTIDQTSGRWVLAFDVETIPDDVVARAKLLLLDTLGCAGSAA